MQLATIKKTPDRSLFYGVDGGTCVLNFTVSRASNLLHFVVANFALTFSSSLAIRPPSVGRARLHSYVKFVTRYIRIKALTTSAY